MTSINLPKLPGAAPEQPSAAAPAAKAAGVAPGGAGAVGGVPRASGFAMSSKTRQASSYFDDLLKENDEEINAIIREAEDSLKD